MSRLTDAACVLRGLVKVVRAAVELQRSEVEKALQAPSVCEAVKSACGRAEQRLSDELASNKDVLQQQRDQPAGSGGRLNDEQFDFKDKLRVGDETKRARTIFSDQGEVVNGESSTPAPVASEAPLETSEFAIRKPQRPPRDVVGGYFTDGSGGIASPVGSSPVGGGAAGAARRPPGTAAYSTTAHRWATVPKTLEPVITASFPADDVASSVIQRQPVPAGDAEGRNSGSKSQESAPTAAPRGRVPAKAALELTLGGRSREKSVPASRLSRVATFGGLAAGLGVGTLAEVVRRGLGIGSGDKALSASGLDVASPFLTEANVDRIVSTLCRVRGAALKLGQMTSLLDSSMISPQLQAVFERVRQNADFMPRRQMEKVLSSELGSDWMGKFASFEDKPFAAASIGQVHHGTLLDGRHVAVKIQYPGVAKSVDSDIDNLLAVLRIWQILPKGLYAENVLDVTRRELAWECDYEREAECMNVFRKLLEGDSKFRVPAVINELSTKRVLTAEFVEGVPLDHCISLDQETRDNVGDSILRLCTSELYDWHIMQTDPNWSNFFYDPEARKIALLDFGATREFSRRFTDAYITVIKAATLRNRQAIIDSSKKLGFLTGYESKVMIDAHVDTVLLLGETCASEGPYDFGAQDVTQRVQRILPVFALHRLTPPPEEIYSLHRKLAGAFLLCARLRSRVNCRQHFEDVLAAYEFGREDRSLLKLR